MPKTELELTSKVLDLNQGANHNRGIWGSYGYNNILDVDLEQECLELLEKKQGVIRVLDVGCGNGLALSQLKKAMDKKGVAGRFEFFGMGINKYEKMYISPVNFLMTGLYNSPLISSKFDLVISVFTFQYIWHKLEGLEKIYNSLLNDGGRAYIHFPGYLVSFSEDRDLEELNEESGNDGFYNFLSFFQVSKKFKELAYSMVPYLSDDDDRQLLAEFGHIRFNKEKGRKLHFGYHFKGFDLFSKGFKFKRMEGAGLTYVISHYIPEHSNRAGVGLEDSPFQNSSEEFSPHRVMNLPFYVGDRSLTINIAIHQLDSDTIVINFPGALGKLTGEAIPYLAMAERIQLANIGAVVRSNNPYIEDVDFGMLNLHNLRFLIEYALNNAVSICGSKNPRLYLMGYSSGGSAIAAIASEYANIEKILLMAPSFDVDKKLIEEGLARFKRELYIVIGDSDAVVLPDQARQFYHWASQARIRKFVEVVSCNHSFGGKYNQAIIEKAPFWAFAGDPDFPAVELSNY